MSHVLPSQPDPPPQIAVGRADDLVTIQITKVVSLDRRAARDLAALILTAAEATTAQFADALPEPAAETRP